MKKDGTLIEALKQLLDWYQQDHRNVRSGGTLYYGLCSMTCDFERHDVHNELCVYIQDNLPNQRYRGTGYCWPPDSKVGRINWLKKHIEILENK